MRNFLIVLSLVSLAACATPRTNDATTAHPFSWLAGNWVGKGLGGDVQETWLPARGKSMVGVFRLTENDEVTFYELITIDNEANGAVMRLKHFHANLHGWEEKNEVETWPATILGKHSVRFGPVDYTLVGDDALNVVVRIEGQPEPMKLAFRRVSVAQQRRRLQQRR